MTRHWVRYSIGVVGISVFSAWLISHSRLAGSSDIDNWIRDAKHFVADFLSHHVEQPLIAIRDELFETFRKRHKGVMELEEVQLTSNSLHRMLLAFSEQTKGQKFPENESDQEMLEIIMGRYWNLTVSSYYKILLTKILTHKIPQFCLCFLLSITVEEYLIG